MDKEAPPGLPEKQKRLKSKEGRERPGIRTAAWTPLSSCARASVGIVDGPQGTPSSTVVSRSKAVRERSSPWARYSTRVAS
jgi:hypothetical protein